MKKVLMGAFAAVTILATSGCATILTEEVHNVNVSTSSGKKAVVKIDGQSYDAPGIVPVRKANRDKVLVTETEGCVSETMLTKEIESEFWINILTGGVFGSTTDMSSEKMWKYQDAVTINCQ